MSPMFDAYRTALLLHHDPHERIDALHEIHGELDDPMFWGLFRAVWESVNSHYMRLVSTRLMLTESRLDGMARLAAMNANERNWWMRACRRGKPIKVYRGGCLQNATGFNWTTKIGLAKHHARRSGQETGVVVTGRLKTSRVILNIRDGETVIAFPEHVETEKMEEVSGLLGTDLEGRRIQLLVEAGGANSVAQMSPAEYFLAAFRESSMEESAVLNHMKGSREFLSQFPFKKRLETIDSIIDAIAGDKDGVRS